MAAIKGFTGQYGFLSNFHIAYVEYMGIRFKSNEHAFQAAKSLNPDVRAEIAALSTPADAKKAGRAIPIRTDWEDVKVDIMEEICYSKFSQNEDLKAMLLATGDSYLEETNSWNDRFWGTCGGKGRNALGAVLMRVRERLRTSPLPDPTGFSPGRRRKRRT